MDVSSFLPVSREDMQARDWWYYDFLVVTADAYVDHPSFGTAIIARVLEAEGYRTAVLAQPDWRSADAFIVPVVVVGEPPQAGLQPPNDHRHVGVGLLAEPGVDGTGPVDTGDAYVDHPSFGVAIISRLLESKGYRVAMLPQPDFAWLQVGWPRPARFFSPVSGGQPGRHLLGGDRGAQPEGQIRLLYRGEQIGSQSSRRRKVP